jgi:hypothetical protein
MKIRITGLKKFQLAGQNTFPQITPNKFQFQLSDQEMIDQASNDFQMTNQAFPTQAPTGAAADAVFANDLKQRIAKENPEIDLPKRTVNFMDVMNAGYNAANLYNAAFNKGDAERERDTLLRNRNAQFNQQGENSMDRGNYGVGPSDYGLFRPDQMGVKSPEGQYNGGRFFQVGGVNAETEQYMVPSIDAFSNTALVNPMDYMPQTMPEMPSMPAQPAETNFKSASISLKEQIATRESGGDYRALPKKKDGSLASSAAGKYQFLWNQHKDTIRTVTGVDSKQAFLDTPDAQEKYFDYWNANTLTPYAQKIKQQYNPKQSVDQIKMMIHFAGPKGAMDYFGKGKITRDAFGTTNANYTGLDTKPGVNINNLDAGLSAFATDMSAQFPGLKISSGNDSKHMSGSKHYQNKAIDIGANSSDRRAYNQLKGLLSQSPQIRQRYGIEDIIDEGDHLHVEMMQQGGEYELTADQIMQIKAMGGDVEFI